MPGCTFKNPRGTCGEWFDTSGKLDVHYRDSHMLPSAARFDADERPEVTSPTPAVDPKRTP